MGLERQFSASGQRLFGKLIIIGGYTFPTVTIRGFRSRRRIEPPRLHPSDGLVYSRRHVGGGHRLGRGTVVSSQPSSGQSALIDSISIIGVETQHPCIKNPPDCFCSVSLICTVFPANWIKTPQGAYCQICVQLWSHRLRGVGEQVSQVPVFCFKIAPLGGQVPMEGRGCRGYPSTRRAANARTAPYKKRERCGCHTAKLNIATRYPHACLATPSAPGRVKHPDSCRRRAKLLVSQGPTLFYPCDRPILVLSDVEILTCEYGAGLICVILG